MGHNNALGAGLLQVQFDIAGEKTLASRSGTAYTLANNINLFNDLTIGQTAGGTGNLTLGGTVALGDPIGAANSRILTVNGSHTITGAVAGTGVLFTKAGER